MSEKFIERSCFKFINPDTLIYACGNNLNSINLERSSTAKSKNESESELYVMAVCDIQSQTEILTSDAPIIAFTTSPKEEIVAYAQILSSVVIIAKFSLNEKVEVLSEIAIPGDVAIKDLVFSYDGRYLAILGDFPQTLISVWDWKSQEMIASAPNNSLASNIAFDPLDPMRLCISGKDGEAKFWDIKMGLHGYSLIQLMGARIGDSIFDDPWNFENKDSSQDTSHLDDKKYPIWGPDRNLISLNNDGSIAYSIDSQSGESNLLLETALLKKQMTCIALNKENFIAGTSDGNLLFFDHSGSYSKTLNIFNGTPILFLTFDPSFSKLLVESSEKQFVYDLGTTEILDLKLRQGVVGVSSDSLSISQLENAGPTSIKLAAEDLQSTEAVAFKSKMKAKLDDIIKSIADLVEANENVPEIERLDKSEFVIDLAERDRLLKETEVTILKMRKDQEGVNMTNRIIMNRIKKECWDSAEVVGRTIKSFKPSELLNDLVKVSNYPIRKRSEAEGARVANLKRLRRVELAVEQSLNINDERKVSVDLGSGVNGKLESKVLSENSKLLYSPSELNSKERQRLQSFILAEVVHDIKLSFNQLFNEIFKDKQDEIAKVEEKNERVKAILDELGIEKTVYHPELDDDEVPENVIKVFDHEIKCEKVLTGEELAKLEEKRIKEEERLRLQGNDNFRERALLHMMDGRLEVRKIKKESEESLKPEWMSKPKGDMTEDEKRQFEEYEQKLAVAKEEQEIERVLLKNELQKLQTAISKLLEDFDSKIFQFSQTKLQYDTAIYVRELSMIKLNQFALTAQYNELIEAKIIKRMDQLKMEKVARNSELPEIMIEMEKRKAENQSAIKKDKLLERSFKREFSADPRFDTLSKLYKKRLLEENSQSTYPLDPFVETSSNLENRSIPLSDNEIPEGLPEEVWVKFLEYRESKMTAELELFKTNQRLREIETILQDVNTALDAIKDETAKLTDTMNRLVQHKFNNAFNIEQLYEFKQGHIEVSQAPLVTNYSDAILIHKSAIETLNDEVIALGQLKVDALTEIKDYRKGIHALEWENKMHDFQAEDMIIKAREVQLLRLSKEMQEYLRNGNVQRQSSEVNNLERMLEHSQKSHLSGLNDREDTIAKLQSSRKKTMQENSRLQKQIEGLRMAVEEKSKIQDIKTSRIPSKDSQNPRKDLFARRRMVDLAKSQAQDIAILQEELERLRLRTFPAFKAAH